MGLRVRGIRIGRGPLIPTLDQRDTNGPDSASDPLVRHTSPIRYANEVERYSSQAGHRTHAIGAVGILSRFGVDGNLGYRWI
jgi:hypothetical protein